MNDVVDNQFGFYNFVNEDIAALYLHNFKEQEAANPQLSNAVNFAMKGFARYAQLALQARVEQSASANVTTNEDNYDANNAIDVEFARMGLLAAFDPFKINLQPWEVEEYRFDWRKFAYVHMDVESAITNKIRFADRMLAMKPDYPAAILAKKQNDFNSQIFYLCDQIFTRIVSNLEEAFLHDKKAELSLMDKFNCKIVALSECHRVVEYIRDNFEGFRDYSNYVVAQGKSYFEGSRILPREDLTDFIEKKILPEYKSADYSDIEGCTLSQGRVLSNLTAIVSEAMNESGPYFLTKKLIEDNAQRNIEEIMRNRGEVLHPASSLREPQPARPLAAAPLEKGRG